MIVPHSASQQQVPDKTERQLGSRYHRITENVSRAILLHQQETNTIITCINTQGSGPLAHTTQADGGQPISCAGRRNLISSPFPPTLRPLKLPLESSRSLPPKHLSLHQLLDTRQSAPSFGPRLSSLTHTLFLLIHSISLLVLFVSSQPGAGSASSSPCCIHPLACRPTDQPASPPTTIHLFRRRKTRQTLSVDSFARSRRSSSVFL